MERKDREPSPEYEDCKKLALSRGVPLKEIFEDARKRGGEFLKGRRAGNP